MAQRTQLALSLSYATTIHKSQGRSIHNLEIHCQGMFAAGQLGVALGRAKTTDTLALCGFQPKCAIGPDKRALRKITNIGSMPVEADSATCCSRVVQTMGESEYSSFGVSDPEVPTDTVPPTEPSELPDGVPGVEHLRKLLGKNSTQDAMVKAMAMHSRYPELYCRLQDQIKSSWTTNIKKLPPDSAHLTSFIGSNHLFCVNELPKLAEHLPVALRPISADLFTELEDNLIFEQQQRQRNDALDAIRHSSAAATSQDSSGQGVLRRLAGRTLVLMKRHFDRSSIATLEKGDNSHYQRDTDITKHLEHLECSVEEAGDDVDTLEETERRQHSGGGLCHITQPFFQFWLTLNSAYTDFNSVERASLTGSKVFRDTFYKLKSDTLLKAEFSHLFLEFKDNRYDLHDCLYDMMLRKYLPVVNNSFRRTLVHSHGVERISALRSGIQGATKRKRAKVCCANANHYCNSMNWWC